MRYDADHKAESRARILGAAAARFRAEGAEAVRVIDVMREAGMTQGGFYRHFADKDELLHSAIASSFDEVATRITRLVSGVPRTRALRTVIDFYLSEEHMRRPDSGCALAALGTEMARMAPAPKRAISRALDAYADRLDFLMPGESAAERRAAFLVLFPAMAGCIMSARAFSSKERQRQILAGGREFFTRAFCGDGANTTPEVTS